MGFFSYRCAVSDESIPADCIEPTVVVAFYPDGRIVQGTYDGYGGIGGNDYYGDLYASQSLVNLLDVKLKGGSIKPWAGSDSEMEFQFELAYRAQVLDSSGSMIEIPGQTTAGYVLKKGLSLEQAYKNRLISISESIKFEQREKFVKLVKLEHYKPDEHRFQTLPSSPRCSYQGFFYDECYNWNRPHKDQITDQ